MSFLTICDANERKLPQLAVINYKDLPICTRFNNAYDCFDVIDGVLWYFVKCDDVFANIVMDINVFHLKITNNICIDSTTREAFIIRSSPITYEMGEERLMNFELMAQFIPLLERATNNIAVASIICS